MKQTDIILEFKTTFWFKVLVFAAKYKSNILYKICNNKVISTLSHNGKVLSKNVFIGNNVKSIDC